MTFRLSTRTSLVHYGAIVYNALGRENCPVWRLAFASGHWALWGFLLPCERYQCFVVACAVVMKV